MVGYATLTFAASFAQSKTVKRSLCGLRTAASPAVVDVAAHSPSVANQQSLASTCARDTAGVVVVHIQAVPLQRKPASTHAGDMAVLVVAPNLVALQGQPTDSTPAVDTEPGGRAGSTAAVSGTKVAATANSTLAARGARAWHALYMTRLRLPATDPPISAYAGAASSPWSLIKLG